LDSEDRKQHEAGENYMYSHEMGGTYSTLKDVMRSIYAIIIEHAGYE
jgi:hypothetical protein